MVEDGSAGPKQVAEPTIVGLAEVVYRLGEIDDRGVLSSH